MTADLRDEAFWGAPRPDTRGARPAARRRRGEGTEGRDRVETRGRARALQALYAADVRDLSQLRRIATQVFDDLGVDPAERAVASRLVATAADHGPALDAALADVTANWRLERLGVVERSVLRLAAAELARGETPVRVVLQEAVRLAERYGTARSARFVNGVLDAYARRIGRL
jgi:N utilization substance protein B